MVVDGKKKVFIRADANEIIGTGHVMRCRSVAQAFLKSEISVTFITADHKGDHLLSGFDVICLNTDWADMESELPCLDPVLKQEDVLLLIIDSYYVTEKYFEYLSKSIVTVYIDDLCKQKWSVHYLVNYNVYANLLNYSAYDSSTTKMLIGLKYTPLRDEFKKVPRQFIKKEVTDILVSTGGADPERLSERFIDEICPKFRNIRFHFVLGALNQRIHAIKEKECENAVLHINVKQMSKLMQACDIAISASGTTLYELCASGLPTITYILADNQIMVAEQFEKMGIMLNAGDCRNNSLFFNNIIDLINLLDYPKRIEISAKMQSVVDGLGAERIARQLLKDIRNM